MLCSALPYPLMLSGQLILCRIPVELAFVFVMKQSINNTGFLPEQPAKQTYFITPASISSGLQS